MRALVELAARDPRLLLLTGDLGFMALEPFAERFPERFFNLGVAEQNMVGVATGLAEAGFIPYVYSIVSFATLRPYEFIRNGPVLHNLPVRIVGVGGGMEYGTNGLSHYGLEDVGIMRIQPRMTVLAPADHEQVGAMLTETWDREGPIYYRLGKDDRTVVPGLEGRFQLGRSEVVRSGSGLLMLSMGAISVEAAKACELLAERGIESTLMVVSTLNPAPVDDLLQVLARFPFAITVEAHYVVGGLGSLVSELVAERGLACRVLRRGVERIPDTVSGSQGYMERINGLSASGIAAAAQGCLAMAPPGLVSP